MQPPQMPNQTAEQDPQAWDKYWQDQELYELWLKNQAQKEYRRNYYANKTRLRQIAKMRELVKKYPKEAREAVKVL